MNSNKSEAIGEASHSGANDQPSFAVPEIRIEATAPARSRRERLVVGTAAKLLPLVELLETIQPQVANESIFHTKRKKINAQIALAYVQLKSERPKRKALTHAFKTMGDIVREESREIGKEEVKDAAKEVMLATIKNAPGLISAAHKAGLLS